MTYHGSGYIPLAASMPVHLDDDECVLRHGVEGWHCVRVLHQGHPCQSPAPTQGRREPHATAGVQPTTTAASQPLAPTALAQPDPPVLDTHPTLGSGTPGGREAGRAEAASNTISPDQPHDPTV